MIYEYFNPFATGFGQMYLQFHTFIDPILAFLLFFSICSAVFKRLKQFEGKAGKGIAIALGAMLTFGFVVFQSRTNFMFGDDQMGIISVIIFLSVLGMLLFDLFKSFAGGGKEFCAFAFTYTLIYSIFLSAYNPVFIKLQTISPLIASILSILFLIALIKIVICIVALFKGSGSLGPGGSREPPRIPPGPSGPTPTDGRIRGDPRPPGRIPPPTPRLRHPTDPPTDPTIVPPGIKPGSVPEPAVPFEPVKPPIPDETEVYIDLSPQFNPIRSQDGLGACTAFASAAAFEYVLSEFHGMPKRYLSTLYQYYRSREFDGDIGIDCGSYTTTSAIILQKNGGCFEDLWAFEEKSTGKWRKEPPANTDADAATKKLVDVRRIDKNDTDQFVYALAEKNPLLIAVNWPADIPENVAFYHNPSPPIGGGHAIVIVGYHSHYPHTVDGKVIGVKAFKIRNSWDVTWGENGYIWMSAETLKKILMCDPIILKGHTASSTNEKFTITGRVVIDTGINPEMTGAKIFESNEFPALNSGPTNDPYYVGAMAQINGKLKRLYEVQVTDPSGKFVLEFSVNPAEFQKLTVLSDTYPKQFSKIRFSEIPEGIIVYKRHKIDPEWYFHIVNFKHSFGGRGGEGYRDMNNPVSNINNQNKNYSGIPITFSQQHNKEANVIIPVYYHN